MQFTIYILHEMAGSTWIFTIFSFFGSTIDLLLIKYNHFDYNVLT